MHPASSSQDQTTQYTDHLYDPDRHGGKIKQMMKGWFKRCPNCEQGQVFKGYLAVNHSCSTCGLELHKQRADDLPPYITISIVGHIVIPLMVVVEKLWAPNLLLQGIGWCTFALVLTLWMLPRVKGAMIALQWSLGMHGFDAPGPVGHQKPPLPADFDTTHTKDA